MDTLQLHVVVALGVTAASAGFDLVSRKIPNFLTFGGIFAGFALNMWSGFAVAGAGGAARAFGLCLLGMFLSAFLPFFFFVRGELVGGGDVKLLAAIGAIVGPQLGFQVLAYAYAVMLCVLLPFQLTVKGRARTLYQSLRVSVVNVFRSREARLEPVPFRLPPVMMGPSILIGFVLCAWFNWRYL